MPSASFQSLFSWMTLIGYHQLMPEFIHGWFQSLFSWMTLIGDLAAVGYDAGEVFQSLFSWMTLIGGCLPDFLPGDGAVSILVFLDDAHRHGVLDRRRVLQRVSILVFLDDAHRQRWRWLIWYTFMVFQSLFSWMTLIGLRAAWVPCTRLRGFNPCFLG